ncbi:SMC-Scp complex subunit ScpB [Ornithinibacillus sp. 4-3]|uniref:Segregation and condensation protein B n=1 Tax=Ornithinibacillus sp. 4-3 TaxID=3231488 RepID=A0AB39HLZ2_9BACI
MNNEELMGVIEGLLFVSGEEGLSLHQLSKIIEVPIWSIEHAVEELQKSYAQSHRGLVIMKSNQIYHLTTKTDHSIYIKRLFSTPTNTRLSQAALETLAIIAYQQPITRTEIEEVRGVNSDRPVQTLLARQLIEEVGRKETVGRPVLFGTSKDFLTYFGLTSIEELPNLNDNIELEDIVEEADLFFDRYEDMQQPK